MNSIHETKSKRQLAYIVIVVLMAGVLATVAVRALSDPTDRIVGTWYQYQSGYTHSFTISDDGTFRLDMGSDDVIYRWKAVNGYQIELMRERDDEVTITMTILSVSDDKLTIMLENGDIEVLWSTSKRVHKISDY